MNERKETGWIRDGHTVEVVNEDGVLSFFLNHPSECHREEHDEGGPFKMVHHLCMIGYEYTNIGLTIEDNYFEEDPLPDVPEEEAVTLPIEYWVDHGWSPSTPVSEEEYWWEFSWRFVKEGRDEDLASAETIENSHGHPREEE